MHRTLGWCKTNHMVFSMTILNISQGVLVNSKKAMKLGYNITPDDVYFQYTTVSVSKPLYLFIRC